VTGLIVADRLLRRPRVYGECLAIGLGAPERPCPYEACRHHLGAEGEPITTRDTCVLYVAAHGVADPGSTDAWSANATLADIATILGVTRERVRQIEAKALRKLGHPERRAGLVEYVETAVARPDLHEKDTGSLRLFPHRHLAPADPGRRCDHDPSCTGTVAGVWSSTPKGQEGWCETHRKRAASTKGYAAQGRVTTKPAGRR